MLVTDTQPEMAAQQSLMTPEAGGELGRSAERLRQPDRDVIAMRRGEMREHRREQLVGENPVIERRRQALETVQAADILRATPAAAGVAGERGLVAQSALS